ncbi:MAG: omptin family outer membrane protease [bacterium]|nr:omptin family outer membrane protease [bacterium]MDD5354020.1 omptin family outer membrane protease [bacterium]MDD5755911.1 omptin family outer membrane protease [bacterium]
MYKFKKILALPAAVLLLLVSVQGWSDDLDPDWPSQSPLMFTAKALAIHSGFLQGHTKYHINFNGGASELEFPLDVPVWGVKGILGYKQSESNMNETARLTFTYLTNTSQDAGKMKDSDWIDDDNHDGVDIYSESDTELKAEVYAFDYLYNMYPNQTISFGPLLGYQVHKFKYRIYNTVQVGYGPYSSETASVTSKTMDYNVRYEAIYLGVGSFSGDIDKLTFNAGFGYSPWAKASDRDDHVLRYKLSEGEAKGSAYIFKGDAEWHFTSQWSLQAAGQYQKFDTDGNQHQTFYDPSLADFAFDVDDNISAQYYFMTIGIIYYF